MLEVRCGATKVCLSRLRAPATVDRKTLQVLGEFVIGAAQTNPPGHQIASDQRGNLYAPQAAQTGADGKGGGATVQKFAFKGFSSGSRR
jgi:hypothetical protein